MKIKSLALLLLVQLMIVSCSKDDNSTIYTEPIVKTSFVYEISNTTAICGGELICDGDKTITDRGIVWNTSSNVTLEVNSGRTTEVKGDKTFSSKLTNLKEGTTYYVRAYITNELETIYGKVKEFKTTNYTKPVVATSDVRKITKNSAICGGAVKSDGGIACTSKGIVWSTHADVSLDDNIIVAEENTSAGGFVCNLTGLKTEVTYYVRAYATNEFGTTYGEEREFFTRAAKVTSVD